VITRRQRRRHLAVCRRVSTAGEIEATVSGSSGLSAVVQDPDLRQSYDYLTIMPKLRSTYDGRLIYKTS